MSVREILGIHCFLHIYTCICTHRHTHTQRDICICLPIILRIYPHTKLANTPYLLASVGFLSTFLALAFLTKNSTPRFSPSSESFCACFRMALASLRSVAGNFRGNKNKRFPSTTNTHPNTRNPVIPLVNREMYTF